VAIGCGGTTEGVDGVELIVGPGVVVGLVVPVFSFVIVLFIRLPIPDRFVELRNRLDIVL
jgi:hypothetical protein